VRICDNSTACDSARIGRLFMGMIGFDIA